MYKGTSSYLFRPNNPDTMNQESPSLATLAKSLRYILDPGHRKDINEAFRELDQHSRRGKRSNFRLATIRLARYYKVG